MHSTTVRPNCVNGFKAFFGIFKVARNSGRASSPQLKSTSLLVTEGNKNWAIASIYDRAWRSESRREMV